MSNSYQRASFRRKIMYWGTILGLFVVSLFARGVVRLEDQPPSWSVRGQAENLEITELAQGDPELTGATMRLLLTGSRGLAVCALWISAQEKQKMHQWSDLELLVRSVMKLQPHFVTPWQFQSWNIAYNVSVELERLNDMYFYIARGISLLAEGESLNKNNPDIRYTEAFYYQNKFGVSDKVNTLRCLYQLSCIPYEDRWWRKLVEDDGKTVNPQRFEQFCREHPQLVRRLRESTVACTTPRDVVDFLRDNDNVPSRYRERSKELTDRLKQFPVLPPPSDQTGPLSPLNPLFGDALSDAYLAAHSWYRYSMEVVPPAQREPGPTINPDPHRYRIPRQPMLIIFRQGGPRALEYVAERLQSEGWYDTSPWIPDNRLKGTDRWFREEYRTLNTDPFLVVLGAGASLSVPIVADDVSIAPSDNAVRAWKEAFSAWQQHGNDNGFLSQSERQQYERRAQRYADRRGVPPGGHTPEPRPEEIEDPDLYDSYKAHRALGYLATNMQVTAFDKHLYRCLVETDPRAMSARKLIAEGDLYKRTGDPARALHFYEEAFELWKEVIRDNEYARDIDPIQEELAEKQVDYDSLLRQEYGGGEKRKALLAASEVIVQAGNALGGMPARTVLGPYSLRPLARELAAFPIPGPLDGIDPKDHQPWIRQDIRDRVDMRLGRNRFRPPTPPPAGGGASTAIQGARITPGKQ